MAGVNTYTWQRAPCRQWRPPQCRCWRCKWTRQNPPSLRRWWSESSDHLRMMWRCVTCRSQPVTMSPSYQWGGWHRPHTRELHSFLRPVIDPWCYLWSQLHLLKREQYICHKFTIQQTKTKHLFQYYFTEDVFYSLKLTDNCCLF